MARVLSTPVPSAVSIRSACNVTEETGPTCGMMATNEASTLLRGARTRQSRIALADMAAQVCTRQSALPFHNGGLVPTRFSMA